MVILISAASSAGNNPSKTVSNPSTATQTETKQADNKPKAETSFKIGDMIKTEKFEIKILSVEERKEVGEKYVSSKPADGGIYVAVKFEYKNISDKPIGMFSFPKIVLQDSNKNKYNQDLSATTYYATEIQPDRKVLSDLNPGIKVMDTGVFEISKEAYAQGEWGS